MNVSELARRINILPQELYEILPQFGYDVGRRAIKMDDRLAQRFLREWPRIRRTWERQKEKTREQEERLRRAKAVAEGTAKEVALPPIVSVRDFAGLLGMPVSLVLHELLRNGILANLNEPIDYATAAIIAEDLGWKAKPVEGTVATPEQEIAATPPPPAPVASGTPRPPVVVVVGHVDHGKTSLLDAIRRTNVAAGEAGAITQHIGAYQTIAQGKPITFIDTPGHEAFTTMRSRGARVADFAILVVAADDGVQPQTEEALKIIQAAGLPFVVAVNKIDKPDASPDRVMQELGARGVTSEAWGGKVPFASISAKTGQGLSDLLEVLLLLADVERDRLLADATGPGIAATVESRLDRNEGPVATLLVQQGTLRIGDILARRGAFMGKVRSLRDHRGDVITGAPPATPVRILGFKVLPEVGDVIEVVADRRGLVEAPRTAAAKATPVAPSAPTAAEAAEGAVVLPIVLRADALGSLEALASEIEKIGDPTIRAKVIGRGLGHVTEGDVQQSAAAKGQIFGFNVRAPDEVAALARREGVPITSAKVIYELLDAIRRALEAMLPEETIREDLGELRILALFRKEARWQVVGGKVTHGKITFDPKAVKVELIRGADVAAIGRLLGLQAGKEEVREVVESQECGVKIGGIDDLQVGDVLRFVKEEARKKVLG